MEPGIWILLGVALAYGTVRVLGRRARHATERNARAEKRAKIARDDAKAIQRTIDGRR